MVTSYFESNTKIGFWDHTWAPFTTCTKIDTATTHAHAYTLTPGGQDPPFVINGMLVMNAYDAHFCLVLSTISGTRTPDETYVKAFQPLTSIYFHHILSIDSKLDYAEFCTYRMTDVN